MVAILFFLNINIPQECHFGTRLIIKSNIELSINSCIYYILVSRHQEHVIKCNGCLVRIKITIFIVSMSAILDIKMTAISYTTRNNLIRFLVSKKCGIRHQNHISILDIFKMFANNRFSKKSMAAILFFVNYKFSPRVPIWYRADYYSGRITY
jgi:hypothetical protein